MTEAKLVLLRKLPEKRLPPRSADTPADLLKQVMASTLSGFTTICSVTATSYATLARAFFCIASMMAGLHPSTCANAFVLMNMAQAIDKTVRKIFLTVSEAETATVLFMAIP